MGTPEPAVVFALLSITCAVLAGTHPLAWARQGYSLIAPALLIASVLLLIAGGPDA